MKAEDLKHKTEDELKKMLLDTRKEQFNLRFQRTSGALENSAQVKRARRSVARIKTILAQKASGEASAAPKAKAAKAAAAPKAKKPAAKKDKE